MHQALTTPSIASQGAKKRRLRWRRYIIFGSIGLVVLVIIFSVIVSKREKPIPVTTEKAVRKTILQTVSATGKLHPTPTRLCWSSRKRRSARRRQPICSKKRR